LTWKKIQRKEIKMEKALKIDGMFEGGMKSSF
jgi:cytoskeletal protein CcmA (bactofilin family)